MWQAQYGFVAAKSLLPSTVEQQLRKLKRRLRPRPLHINELSAYVGGLEQVFLLRAAGLDIRDRDALELGTGWAPIMPLIFRIAGARHVYLTDHYDLLTHQNIKTCVDFVRARADDLSKRLNISLHDVESRLKLPDSTDITVTLDALGMSYQVPFYFKGSTIKVDAIISNAVFEHIPRPVLQPLIGEMRHLLRPGGLMSHFVDNSDHWEHIDGSRSRVDFLKYSDQIWAKIHEHPRNFSTNRLRHSDYVGMIKDAGYQVIFEIAYHDEKSRLALQQIALPERFRSHSEMDLSTIHTHIIARVRDERPGATI